MPRLYRYVFSLCVAYWRSNCLVTAEKMLFLKTQGQLEHPAYSGAWRWLCNAWGCFASSSTGPDTLTLTCTVQNNKA